MSRPAGDFGEWLARMRRVLRGEAEADVPCDGCVGCCVSAYPIPLRPQDQVALAVVPARYLELPRAGGLARMTFRDDGRCPMLEEAGCAIYADRPRTCRDYDCRIYTAAGLMPDGERPVIQARVAEWRFSHRRDADRRLADGVREAAQFIRSHADAFPASMRAHSATAAAVLAVKVHAVFEVEAPADDAGIAQRVQQIVDAARAFDAVEG